MLIVSFKLGIRDSCRNPSRARGWIRVSLDRRRLSADAAAAVDTEHMSASCRCKVSGGPAGSRDFSRLGQNFPPINGSLVRRAGQRCWRFGRRAKVVVQCRRSGGIVCPIEPPWSDIPAEFSSIRNNILLGRRARREEAKTTQDWMAKLSQLTW